METQLQIFKNPDFGDVRTIIRDGEPWFVAADVCRALDVDSTATRRLDDDEKGLHSTQTLGGEQNMTIVNEPGLYSLVLGSRKPEAKAFKRWITHDVIPAIRRHGMYAIDGSIHSKILTMWTQKGRLFIYELLKARGILPLIERS